MIQRIQTVYLFLAAVVIFMIFWFPLAEVLLEGVVYTFKYSGIYEISADKTELIIQALPLAVLYGLVMFISLISIFLYKKRVLQMRLSVLNILLLIGSYALAYYYIYAAFKGDDTVINPGVSAIFPLIAAIFTYLAFRG
ncbi:MAG: DUF4293 domain-containing protein, partial [Bacteroidales bacterium]|nr:DUF4293 domain-containing protein [Bacteroidales bacterium]